MSLRGLKPGHKMPAVKKSTLGERFLYCAAMLYLNDFLTDAERRKVHQRMMKWKAKHEKKEKS